MDREEIIKQVLASLALDDLYVSDEVVKDALKPNARVIKKEKEHYGSGKVE